MVGNNVVFHKLDLVNIYGGETTQIGENTKVSPFTEIQGNVVIGRNCKISSHSFICSDVIIEDSVFIGHNCSFCNDKTPRATVNGLMKGIDDWKSQGIRVKAGASIGSGSVILPGITIGKNAMVGANSTISRDVPDNMVVFGSPARPNGHVSY